MRSAQALDLYNQRMDPFHTAMDGHIVHTTHQPVQRLSKNSIKPNKLHVNELVEQGKGVKRLLITLLVQTMWRN
jgi:hypothetical protein